MTVKPLAEAHRDAANWVRENAFRDAVDATRGTEDDAAPAPEPRPVIMPCPPGLDPEKWATLDRKTRRELWRYHRRLQRRAEQ